MSFTPVGWIVYGIGFILMLGGLCMAAVQLVMMNTGHYYPYHLAQHYIMLGLTGVCVGIGLQALSLWRFYDN